MGHFVFPKLTDEKQFEHLVADCYRALLPSALVDEYGRRGQKQHGIDITVQIESQLWCIQCKNYETISISDIAELLTKCTYYNVNPFSKLIIATAALNDTNIIDYLIEIRKTRRYPFDLEFLPWEKICSLVESYPQVFQKYYGPLHQADTFKNNFLEIIKRYGIGAFLRIDPMIEGLALDIPPALDNCKMELERLLDDYVEKNGDTLYFMIRKFMNWLDAYNGNLSTILFYEPRRCSKFTYLPSINGIDESRKEKEQLILQYKTELTNLLYEIAAYPG